MSEKYKFIGDAAYDNLISGVYPAPLVSEAPVVESNSTNDLKRGTVLVLVENDSSLNVPKRMYYPAGLNVETSTATGDGTKYTFEIHPHYALKNYEKILKVTVAGTEVTDYSYNKETGEISLAPPASGAQLKVTGAVGTPCGIVAEDVSYDSAESAYPHVPMYTAGCFDPNFLVTVNDYKLDAEDIDHLRKFGIYIEEATK